MTALKQTPSQTLGPFFAYGLTPEQFGYAHRAIAGNRLAAAEVPGQHIRIEGRIVDGAGEPIDDAMIEIWQADADGRYAGADRETADSGSGGFAGFGRCGTDDEGGYSFTTIKPGAIGDGQAPHIGVIVQARGILNHAFTRIYFADETDANDADPVLQAVPEDRRHTLVAARGETPGGPVYRFDIHMQGDEETVFFDI
ncbi:MAG TPA: protocatechuate 3,4-dioxygenase subunit alpha [Afifellaceae bacterium]|nr:protocatechuate 3,4-dioxygenase subunit alpha [Afifellaceae bacterium]